MANIRKNHFNPDYASPPGNTLKETLEMRGMSQTDLAERLSISKKTIDEIIAGKVPITPEMATMLEAVLNVPASFWNAREQQYRESLLRLKSIPQKT